MWKSKSRFLVPILAVAAVLWIGALGCTDEKTIYVERPFFQDPAPEAAGFLGYDEADAKLTVCGNCHVGQQTRWKTSAHADAWDGLQASGHANEACENCHTTGPLGNATEGEVGYAGTLAERYYDVQCESCHGSGLAHVLNPDVEANQPLASLGASLTTSCGECHQAAHHPFVEEWEQSLHAEVNDHIVERLEGNPNDAACSPCHTGQAALASWGVTNNFLEADASGPDHFGITCAVCHDPHGSMHSGQLRFPIDVASEEQNLCMKCHHKRAEPETESATIRGPHSPEGPLLLGEAGWWPPGFEPKVDRIVASHGTEGNKRLCAGCHVTTFDVTSEGTGEFLFSATGHLFQAIPCLDDEGIPTTSEDCEDNERYFAGCATSGCHATAEAALNAYQTAKGRIADLVVEIDMLLEMVPEEEFVLNDGNFTLADGAWFNARLGDLPGTSTHNPFLSEQLLTATAKALRETYGLSSPTGVSLDLIYE